MRATRSLSRTQLIRWGLIAAAAAAAFILRRPAALVLSLMLGGTALAFLALPLAGLYEKRLSRPNAALAALLSLAAGLMGILMMSLPSLTREFASIARTLPRAVGALEDWLKRAAVLAERILPGVSLPALNLEAMLPAVPGLAAGTLGLAGGFAGAAGRISAAAVLSYFFLRDRETLELRLELLLPAGLRPMAVKMARAVGRELRLYLRAQLLISLAVGLTAAVALLMLGVRSAFMLGLLIGIMNIIPYFGPFIGGLPAVLIALADSPQKALLTAAALCLVQQLDGAVISPRILGSVTGLSPALVLVALFAGAERFGLPGMLFTVPVLITIRTLFRVYVQRAENI